MIRVVTDSSSDLPPELAAMFGIEVVSLSVRFGDEEFTDREDLTAQEFWKKLVSDDRLPETAAPSAGAFADRFARLFAEGADGIVAVTISSSMSATYQAAVIAAEASAKPVRVVDSRTVTMALGLAAVAAAESAQAGNDLASVAGAAASTAASSRLLAALDTLDFLKRGGRIGGAQALLGSLLDIKPLITVDDGVVAAAGRVRTRSKAVDAIVGSLEGTTPSRVAILHTGDDGENLLRGALSGRVDPDSILSCELGAVVGTHAGPGTLGLAYVG